MSTRMTVEEAHQYMLEWRAIETPCDDCNGWGVKAYGDTATWRGGVGGQTITSDVCNKCWGSGDKHRRWPSHRLLKR